MGSSASKPAARKLARTPPAWAGARTPGFGEQAHPHARPTAQASEKKDEAILRDSQDPQFLANLSKLGPVTVDHHMQTIRPAAASAQQLYQTRLRSEDEARSSRPTQNRLVASSLMDLLEERKFVSTEKEVAELAKKYGVDLEKLERLARHVNSVSVNQDTVKRWVGKDGVENVTMVASWVNPRIEWPVLGSGR
ncbi:hypothetical protein L226DRAFT_530091 [Lentinus tigrinus ALCF2SS1-7]|uniref:Uncharacterized protein n=1 Tax=Lentinus tigrinus ALCF2SS1-6 TaxID=1328759 RepID=A0A5C2SQN6_9APHY|nr:hypothetical protein L227DRAFT_569890 [Lentinus tigrinus ALCF2SS1-6]RPD79898.1 hypothetical protein L226DRAFT_530091 [Lentinus tigrinus ALCF2SS1-7]